MRLKITFKANKDFQIPYNNNYTIATIIYNALEDQDYATSLHDGRGFKYFTFSQVQIPRLRIEDDGLVSRDGRFQVQVSSVSYEFIKNLWHGLLINPLVDFHGAQVEVEKAEIMKEPEFQDVMEYRTLSPIYLRTLRDGKTWDLGPDEKLEFQNRLYENLLKKHTSYYEKSDFINKLKLEILKTKQKRVIIQKGDLKIYHRAHQMRFTIEMPVELQRFAWQVGLGEKNSMGFGMIG